MIRHWQRGILVVGFAIFSSVAWAAYTGEADPLLNDKEAAGLPEGAKLLYQKAAKAFDHVDRDSGVAYLEQAAKAAPDYVPLQFVLATRSRDRARFYSGVRALEYYDKGEEAVQRILRQPLLSLEDKRRAEQMLRSIQQERELLPSKDKKMAETGYKAIVIPIAVQRAKSKGVEVTPEKIAEALGEKPLGAEAGAASPVPLTSQFPVPSASAPLASYSVPTEKPPAPPPGQFMPGAYPGYPGAAPAAYPAAPGGEIPII